MIAIVGAWALTLGLLGEPAPNGSPLVPEGAMFETLTKEVDFAEGPAAGLDGAIYFSDIPTGEKPGRILKYDPATGQISVFRADSAKSNGLAVDAVGRLVACEGADFGGRRISRYEGDGPAKTVVDRFEGKRLNAPNDLCIDAKGRIWFSDPKYLGAEPRELDHRSVFRVDPDGSLHIAVTQPAIDKPNGVEASPDGKTLYVADTNGDPVPLPDGTTRPGSMKLLAFTIDDAGAVSDRRVLVDFAPGPGVDGMTCDVAGNVYAAVRQPTNPAIHVFAPSGKLLGKIPLPDVPTNCVFGRGAEANRLYVTMDKAFGRIRLNAMGYHPPARAQ